TRTKIDVSSTLTRMICVDFSTISFRNSHCSWSIESSRLGWLKNTNHDKNTTCADGLVVRVVSGPRSSSPRRSQLEPGLIERGTFQLKRLHRAAVIEFIPWN